MTMSRSARLERRVASSSACIGFVAKSAHTFEHVHERLVLQETMRQEAQRFADLGLRLRRIRAFATGCTTNSPACSSQCLRSAAAPGTYSATDRTCSMSQEFVL